MVQIDVENKKTGQKYQARFEDQATADAWIESEGGAGHWGEAGDFEVTKTDVTAEVEAERTLDKARRAQAIGADVVALVWGTNESKGLSPEQLQALIADPKLQAIERLLRNGALQTAKALIQALQTDVYTADDKARLVQYIDDHPID